MAITQLDNRSSHLNNKKMGLFYPIIIIGAVILIGATAALFLMKETGDKGDKKHRRGKKGRDRQSTLREANRRLAQNPKDPEAHQSLAELFFQEKDYDQALKHYKTCIDLVATYPEIDEFEVTLRHALSALNLKRYDEAYKSFMIARSLNGENFEVNYNLGYMEFLRKNYQKSAFFLNKAQKQNPEHVATNRYLGQSLYRMKRYKNSIPYLLRALEYEPDNKSILFNLAQSYYELAQYEKALKIFSHLRTDPNLGAHSALYSGTIHLNTKQYQKAVMDFEIGLRHENIPKEVVLELKYRMAAANLNHSEIGTALQLWREIQEINPDYRDVREQIAKFQEINTNRHLQIFLMASSSEFITLCRKITSRYFPKTSSKLLDISMHKNEYVDILAEVHAQKWDDLIVFRFIRTSGQIGDLMLRELYTRVKELKAGRGICITSGLFSDTARAFVEARLIDLVEKKELLKLFDRIADWA